MVRIRVMQKLSWDCGTCNVWYLVHRTPSTDLSLHVRRFCGEAVLVHRTTINNSESRLYWVDFKAVQKWTTPVRENPPTSTTMESPSCFPVIYNRSSWLLYDLPNLQDMFFSRLDGKGVYFFNGSGCVVNDWLRAHSAGWKGFERKIYLVNTLMQGIHNV